MSATAAAKSESDSKAVSSVASDVAFKFPGKLAVVTGSTVGIGYAIAYAFVKSGADVVINGRDQKTVDSVVTKLNAERADTKSQTIYGIGADVGTASGCQSFISKLEALNKPVDFLINNVSIFAAKEWTANTDDEWVMRATSQLQLHRPCSPLRLRLCCCGGVV